MPVCYNSDEPVILLNVLLTIYYYTHPIEKPLPTSMSTESSPGSEEEEGKGDQQMTPQLLNKAFSVYM